MPYSDQNDNSKSTTMKNITRRTFLERSMATCAAGLVAPAHNTFYPDPTPRMIKDDISIAQWALVDEIRSGKWKTLDFPSIARKDFGLNGIEFVNTLFEVPTLGYLNRLKKNAEDNNVTMVLIMVDDEGDGCAMTKEERKNPKILNGRRRLRIAKGSGTSVQEVNRLIKQFEEMQKMMKMFSNKRIANNFINKMGLKI